MSKSVEKWIVEETNPETGKKVSREYSSYDDALDMYNELKLNNENACISIEKSKKRLLLEG